MKTPARIALGLGLAGMLAAGAAIGLNQQNATALTEAPQAAAAQPSGPNTFAVDVGHSSSMFRIKHMGVANFMGRFNKFDGSYTLDPENLDAASVDTNSARRDGHVKAADFFDVANHPNITFKSTSAEANGEDSMLVRGDLTFLGITKTVDVKMNLIGIGDTPQGFKSGVDAYFKFKRSDFGNDTYVASGGLSDEVEVWISIEGVRR